MRTNRPYVQIDPDVLERVRQIDLLSYLREFEPSNLVKVKGTSNVYCTAEHDSLKISNGKWYWWSRGFGGYSALDYLIKVKEYDFVEAVGILTEQTMADWKPPPAPKKDKTKVLLLPPKNKDCNRVIQYLFRRGIDYQLIQECISDGTLLPLYRNRSRAVIYFCRRAEPECRQEFYKKLCRRLSGGSNHRPCLHYLFSVRSHAPCG